MGEKWLILGEWQNFPKTRLAIFFEYTDLTVLWTSKKSLKQILSLTDHWHRYRHTYRQALMTKNLLIYLPEINVYAYINTKINVMYHSCFCNLTVNESHLQNILIRMVYLQQVFLLLTIITCLWAKILSLALTFCLKVHSNLGMQRFNILVVYIRKDWKHFFLIKSVFLFIYYVLFGYPLANFGPLPRAQPHSPNLHHSVYVKFQPKSHWEPPNKIWFLNPAKRLV